MKLRIYFIFEPQRSLCKDNAIASLYKSIPHGHQLGIFVNFHNADMCEGSVDVHPRNHDGDEIFVGGVKDMTASYGGVVGPIANDKDGVEDGVCISHSYSSFFFMCSAQI